MRIAHICLLLLLFAAALPSTGNAAAEDKNALLEVARDLVAREALTPPSPEAAASGMLKGYLRSVDVYSTYLSPEEVHQMGRQKLEGFVGIGMDVLQDASGIIYCMPFPHSPAEKAGIRYGDILLSLDDKLVGAVPFPVLKGMASGEKGTAVQLGVTGAEGPRTLKVTREAVHIPHVVMEKEGPFSRLRIFRFTPETPALLRKTLAQLDGASPLVLDLRGNPGGDMDAALASAALFLDRGSILSIQMNRKGEQKIHKAGAAPLFSMPLALWQDRFTASAAEVFIAALSQNGRGKILGRRSFGKGVSQRIAGTGDGGLFILTTAKLLQPDGKPYHGTGLEPDLLVGTGESSDRDYVRRTYEAFGLRP